MIDGSKVKGLEMSFLHKRSRLPLRVLESNVSGNQLPSLHHTLQVFKIHATESRMGAGLSRVLKARNGCGHLVELLQDVESNPIQHRHMDGISQSRATKTPTGLVTYDTQRDRAFWTAHCFSMVFQTF